MTSIPEQLQKFNAEKMITLYEIDYGDLIELNSASSTVFRFTNSSDNGSAVLWDSNFYVPIQIEADGFEWTGDGALPTPTIKISAVGISAAITSALLAFDDLLGAKFTRIKTFERFLDNGSEPDVTRIFPLEIYRIARKSVHSKNMIEFEIQSAFDQEGTQLPGRDALRDTCPYIYRRFSAASNEIDPLNPYDTSNTKVTCPYTDLPAFDINGNPTTPQNDICSKLLSTGCEPRFVGRDIPGMFFPSIGSVRVR